MRKIYVVAGIAGVVALGSVGAYAFINASQPKDIVVKEEVIITNNTHTPSATSVITVTPTPTVAPIGVEPVPVAVPAPAPAVQAPENVGSAPSVPLASYGDPTSCPEGSTLVNDIPQMPPRCSVPVPSDFVETGRPPA